MRQKGHTLQSIWFDGLSPRPQPVVLSFDGQDLTLRPLESLGAEPKRYPLAKILWAERRTHGLRQTDLPDGTMIQHANAGEWDAWTQINEVGESPVVGWMQSWRGVAGAGLATVAFLFAAWVWGVPWVSTTIAHWVPDSVDRHIGEAGLKQLDTLFLEPSRLPHEEQEALRKRFEGVVKRAYSGGEAPQWSLAFYKSELLGANAFALPGGFIVVTDDLVDLLKDVPDATVGVLSHELGHVQHRHGLDLLVRASLVSAMVGVVIGDASGFLATVPVTLVTQAYSRDAERESDAQAARMLDASGISPTVMATFFERIAQAGGRKSTGATKVQPPKKEGDESGGFSLPIAISSHPNFDERIRFFRTWTPSNDRP